MFGFWLIAILAVLGGIIAYIGDTIGMKIGRKRLSIFKLRPKHTSTLITVLTGILIAGGTLGAMAIVSKDVQTALFGMTQLKHELSTLAAKVKGKDLELTVTSKNLANARTKYKWVQDLNERLNEKIREKQELLDQIVKKLDALATQNTRLTKEKAKLDAGLNRARADINTLRVTKKNLEKQIAANQDKLAKLKRIVYQQESYIREQQERLKAAQEAANYWQSEAQGFSNSDIAYRVLDAIDYTVMNGGGSEEDVRKQFANFSEHANKVAAQRVQRENPLICDYREYDQILQFIQQHNGQYVVAIYAKQNSIIGDKVNVGFSKIENKLVFHKGDLIYSAVVDGSSPEEVNKQFKVIIRKVSEIADEKGIVKTTGGSIDNIVGWYDTIRQISDAGKRVKVSIYTDSDIWTAGPLTVIIRPDFDYTGE